MTEPEFLQLRDFHKALNADVVKKAAKHSSSPPWVKDHAGQLEDPEYSLLSMSERGLLKDLRLLACRRANKIRNNEAYLRVQLGYTSRTRLVPKLYKLRTLRFLEPYNTATNDAAKALLPSRPVLEAGEIESRLEGYLEESPTPYQPKAALTCHVCALTFKTQRRLEEHLANVHDVVQEDDAA